MDDIAELIHGLLRVSNENHPSILLNRTKIIKLLYILDRNTKLDDSYRGRSTSIQYINYTYGPYSEDILDSIEKGENQHLFHEFELNSGSGKVYRYELCNCPENRSQAELSDKNLEHIEKILSEYGDTETDDLVSMVKLYTEVQNSSKYEPIDLGFLDTS